MEIRLRGTPEECDVVTELIERAVRVLSVSRPYPDRGPGGLVRVFLDARAEKPLKL